MSTRGFPAPFQKLQKTMMCPKLWISWLLRRMQILTRRMQRIYPHPISDRAYYLQRHRGLRFHCQHLRTLRMHHIPCFYLNTTTPASWEIFPWLPILLGFQVQIPHRLPHLSYVNRMTQTRGHGGQGSELGLQNCTVLQKDRFLLSLIFNDIIFEIFNLICKLCTPRDTVGRRRLF